MKVKVALTGASGNMGSEALRQLLELEDVEFVRILVLGTSAKDRAFGAAAKKNATACRWWKATLPSRRTAAR